MRLLRARDFFFLLTTVVVRQRMILYAICCVFKLLTYVHRYNGMCDISQSNVLSLIFIHDHTESAEEKIIPEKC